MTDIKHLLTLGVTIITLVAAMFAFDARYWHAAQANEVLDRAAVQRELGDLEAQLQLATLELEYIEDSDAPGHATRRDYLRARITVITERLLELRGGQDD